MTKKYTSSLAKHKTYKVRTQGKIVDISFNYVDNRWCYHYSMGIYSISQNITYFEEIIKQEEYPEYFL